jgi:hypothetical protein
MRERILTVLAVLGLTVGIIGISQPEPQNAEAQAGGSFYRQVTFADDVVITVDAQSDAFEGFADATLVGFVVGCTENSGTATIDAAIQRSLDGGATWADIIAFTQLAATGAETKLYADVRAASAQMIGDMLRVDWDVTGTGNWTCDMNGAAEA